jgi:hypothetical protein
MASARRLVKAAVVAAVVEPVGAHGRVALMPEFAARAAVRVVVVRAAENGAVSVDDQRTRARLHPAMLRAGSRDARSSPRGHLWPGRKPETDDMRLKIAA